MTSWLHSKLYDRSDLNEKVLAQVPLECSMMKFKIIENHTNDIAGILDNE
jgi:hypothetical protein